MVIHSKSAIPTDWCTGCDSTASTGYPFGDPLHSLQDESGEEENIMEMSSRGHAHASVAGRIRRPCLDRVMTLKGELA